MTVPYIRTRAARPRRRVIGAFEQCSRSHSAAWTSDSRERASNAAAKAARRRRCGYSTSTHAVVCRQHPRISSASLNQFLYTGVFHTMIDTTKNYDATATRRVLTAHRMQPRRPLEPRADRIPRIKYRKIRPPRRCNRVSNGRTAPLARATPPDSGPILRVDRERRRQQTRLDMSYRSARASKSFSVRQSDRIDPSPRSHGQKDRSPLTVHSRDAFRRC